MALHLLIPRVALGLPLKPSNAAPYRNWPIGATHCATACMIAITFPSISSGVIFCTLTTAKTDSNVVMLTTMKMHSINITNGSQNPV